MDPGLYREGNIVVFEQYVDQLEAQVTPNKNTVLHIAAQFGNSQCVRENLNKNLSLLNRQNAKGDIVLHVAARKGQMMMETRPYTMLRLPMKRAKSTRKENLSLSVWYSSSFNFIA
ncbi:hypothetical protein LOK49_LG06G02821 [Camellia lanceoleosa]|uniref:Uncharacterized protein n=1 Tax=Camellia lanceoleosa TaxID=1840588 RepID=A0ACC0HGY4_9ERIC|nr:hypothetical protein LOK49_LG06G02821 [Camellia lanceoleosa]